MKVHCPSTTILALACSLCMTSAWAQQQQNGAPPGNTSSGSSNSGKNAGFAGGAGAAGRSGTDPATLSRIEEQRVQKKNAPTAAKGASTAGAGKRKDWKE
ncbi:hypothetical protein AWB77_05925 [Caballeronia fortuita]|uniref:Lipoprotein n=1 Tax=Caballeronia fortuita TaxID=1777138 RepID=A0A158DWY3_9BURK|nr:hypothetical protein [Caballeronia fortuita]SAK99053.1 hypothetical protein AWB77_05925 [Caballeronia fortuita]